MKKVMLLSIFVSGLLIIFGMTSCKKDDVEDLTPVVSCDMTTD